MAARWAAYSIRPNPREVTKNQNSRVVIAEHFFENFQKNHRDKKDNKNSLDFEYILTEISEKVIIVLESHSSFCELGAFSHNTLRKKLLVINDSKHQETRSFINTGPILALTEDYGYKRVLWYDMKERVDEEDSIASIFLQLEESIGKSAIKIGDPVDIDPTQGPTTIEKALFIHDIIYFYKPDNYSSLIRILKEVFGNNKSFDMIRHIIAILTSLKFIQYDPEKKSLKSLNNSVFLSYGDKERKIKSGFQLSMLKQKMRA
ncbi:retron St85 family effector protein [Vreelandella stevensii]|uniref:retron St85 family effector protein n=1 Tax=Vreelandella stevensii TaxID=502821 RepID=UPI00403A8FC1